METASDALLVTDSVALNVPAAFGVKLMYTGTLCPAAMVIGKAGPAREKYFVEMLAVVIVIDADPEFVTVIERFLLVPAFTLPKSRELTANASVLL